MAENNTIDVSKCISCGKCTKSCLFLEKYQLDLSDKQKLKEVAFNCFLCGRCTAVCPVGIDGRALFLELRKELTRGKKSDLKKYAFLRFEKQDYIFRNTKNSNKNSVLFMGCNFPSVYPKTSKKLIKIMKDHDIGVWFDCCGKPISELGLLDKEDNILKKLANHAEDNKIEEIITVCPNCYYYLKEHTTLKVINIYDKLSQLGIGSKIQDDSFRVFLPCPDRTEKSWLENIKSFLSTEPKIILNPQCCGLGGLASGNEPDISNQFRSQVESLLQQDNKDLYVYCASCAIPFSKENPERIKHVLPEIIGSYEIADIKHTLRNRFKFKFYKG